MYQFFISILLMLFLSGCSEQEVDEQDVLNSQVIMLKSLCDNKTPCFDDIDRLAESCRQKYPIDNENHQRFETDQIINIGEFGACIIMQMDQQYQTRFNEFFPVKETGVEITRPSRNINAKGLLVRLMKGKVRITEKSKQNKDLQLNHLSDYIISQKLANRYSMVMMFVDEDAGTGDLVEAMDIFKNAGLEEIHISSKK